MGNRRNPQPLLNVTAAERLPVMDVTWEANFCELSDPLRRTDSRYFGVVVHAGTEEILHQTEITSRPTALHFGRLIQAAMTKPWHGTPHRPRRLHIRGPSRWRGLQEILEGMGTRVVVADLPLVSQVIQAVLDTQQSARRQGMSKPTGKQQAVETLFPSLARWVEGGGAVEIGDPDSSGFVVRALDEGGIVFEDARAETLSEAMTILDEGLAAHIREAWGE